MGGCRMVKNYLSSYSKINFHILTITFSVFLIFFFWGCNTMKTNDLLGKSETYYFSSPAEAIPIITELVKTENLKVLARYYDLSNSEIKLAELESGDFFIRKERPEVAHPAGFWRYKHPFAPGFKFSSVQAAAKDPIYIVEVSISIDQGLDSPIQSGLSYFYMLKSDNGWKILPDAVSNDDRQTMIPTIVQ